MRFLLRTATALLWRFFAIIVTVGGKERGRGDKLKKYSEYGKMELLILWHELINIVRVKSKR